MKKWNALVGYWVNYATSTFDLNFDLNHGFEIAVSHESLVWLMWYEKEANQFDTGSILWPCTLTIPLTLALNSQGQSLKYPFLSNESTNWYGTKGTWINHSWQWLTSRWLCWVCEVGDIDDEFRREWWIQTSARRHISSSLIASLINHPQR